MPKDIIYILHNFPIPKCYDVSRPNIIGKTKNHNRN
ncbi:MAG: hypothetical protein UX22_C0018G0002 [Candidatus Jorgensenbacteria bacterium GW2011_GWA2_45_9]|uniref:Uncharacterized protein n=1 Tax=Candidatus Jorgensenbacteria bacterium GW2011_GWA2_45_9 TaxID=1618663 RepID=A0A0G1N282_9BACT|nr:MAG: hypothetical protein UX22_C0018G0002 [Candidatus Jorgensenbacteria bacterium GW2011_GWA2_45_9]